MIQSVPRKMLHDEDELIKIHSHRNHPQISKNNKNVATHAHIMLYLSILLQLVLELILNCLQ
jgi:hypothetical protein